MQRLTTRRIGKGLRGLRAFLRGYPIAFNWDKARMIDLAFSRPDARSFADLGGVWGVNGAYTFYTLRRHSIDRAALVDTSFTDRVRRGARRFPQLQLVNANFGNEEVARGLGSIDALYLFDVLLHQVAPDWNQILDMYAPHTRCFVVFNQQFVAGDRTVRLIDLGIEEYFRHVRFDPESPGYRDIREHPDAIHPEHGRPWRDVHNVWQWGITDRDLEAHMASLGFDLDWKKNLGRFSDWESFENHGFLFRKK